MSKSVLVIDTPGSCMGCNFFIFDGDTNMDSCMARETARSVDLEKYDKPDWCPLKPLPKKKEYVDPTSSAKAKKNIIAVGWNTCINMIVKGDSDD